MVTAVVLKDLFFQRIDAESSLAQDVVVSDAPSNRAKLPRNMTKLVWETRNFPAFVENFDARQMVCVLHPGNAVMGTVLEKGFFWSSRQPSH